MMTSKSVETLIDLVEIKLSCLEVWDREDARERRALEIALNELVSLRGMKHGADVTPLRPATAA